MLDLACRNAEKGHQVVQELAQRTGNPKIELVHLDLNELASVRKCAKELISNQKIPDILILNAGVMNATRKETMDGLEQCLGVNYMAHFEFTRLLLPHMVAQAKSSGSCARVVALTSNTHIIGRMRWADIQLNIPGSYSLFRSYAQSKLASTFHRFNAVSFR